MIEPIKQERHVTMRDLRPADMLERSGRSDLRGAIPSSLSSIVARGGADAISVVALFGENPALFSRHARLRGARDFEKLPTRL
jgi:hypothetical protein